MAAVCHRRRTPGAWPPCVSCAAAVRWTASLDNHLRTLEQVGEALRWQPPVYLWQVTDSDWSQDARVTQTVGALFPARATPTGVERQLRAILPSLRERGMQQLCAGPSHDFLLRFGRQLEKQGISHWIVPRAMNTAGPLRRSGRA